MLSKREREFLESPEKFPRNYARRLRFTIRRKIKALSEELELITRVRPELLREIITYEPGVTFSRNTVMEKNFEMEGRGWDSNPGIRLHRPEG